MPYYLKNTETGNFVAPAGQHKSYVKELQFARPYATREEAEKDRCPGNEVVLSLEQIHATR